MKKIVALIFAGVIACSMAGCSNDAPEQPQTSSSPAATDTVNTETSDSTASETTEEDKTSSANETDNDKETTAE